MAAQGADTFEAIPLLGEDVVIFRVSVQDMSEWL